MNLADMLSFADIRQLGMIADSYECVCNGHSKNELIQTILATVNRRDVLEDEVQRLSIEELRFIHSVLFEKRQFFSLEELMARVNQTCFDQDGNSPGSLPREGDRANRARDTLTRFKHRGWLFNGHSNQTKYLFQFPADLKRRFGETIADLYRRNLVTIVEPAAYRDERGIMQDDVQRLLTFVNQNEIALSVDGTMYKRSLQQILSILYVNEQPISSRGWRFGYGRKFKEYPNRFSFIYDYCYHKGYLNESEQTLQLTQKGKQKWLSGAKEDSAQLYRYWLRLYSGPIPNLQSLVRWIDLLCVNWTTVASLTEVLYPIVRPYYYDTAQSIIDQRIVQMMMHLGLLRIGEDETAGKVVHITPFGSEIINETSIQENEQIPACD